jgi:shikimate kinase
MPDVRNIFIIGPAGVGKSTCGRMLAEELGYSFVDLDSAFLKRIGNIPEYIEKEGYVTYGQRNTDLFFTLIAEQERDTVYAMSAGFLLYQDPNGLSSMNAEALSTLGVSILLLPSRSLEESVSIVVERVLARRPRLNREKETRKIIDRYPKYLQHGDIKIFSAESPSRIAARMQREYLDYTARAGEESAG